MARPTERQVADWLLDLGKLVAGSMTYSEVNSRLKAYVPELVERYPADAFNSRSREHVARGCKFFPSYGELCALLDNVPPVERPALPSASDDDGLNASDRSWLAFYHKRRAELWAQQGGFPRGSRDAELANLASAVRGYSPKAWGLIDPSSVVIQDRPTEQQIAAVTRALRMPGGPLCGRGEPDQPAAKPRVRPSRISPEQLARSRAARGVVTGEVVR